MGSESPDVVLYDVNGNPLAVQNATAIPASTSALMVAGSDGTDSRYLSTDTSGHLIIEPGNTANTTPWLMTINQGSNSAGVSAKGTQATNALGVQELKDSGRVAFSAICSATAGVTSEALISLTPVRTVTAGSAATTLTVTSGKILRLQSLVLSVRNTSTVVSGAIIRVRMLAGTVLVGSQEMFSLAAATLSATSGVTGSATLVFPDGFEISGTTQVGISQLCSATTCTIDVALVGFEY